MQLLERPLLIDRLLSFPAGSVIVLQAPAGFGKTCLLHALKSRVRSATADDFLDGRSHPDRLKDTLTRIAGLGGDEHRPWIFIDDADQAPEEWRGRLAAFLSDQNSRTGRVIVAVRDLRSLPFARLRAHRRLHILDATQLRLSKREAYSIYTQIVGPRRVQKLWEFCAGWPSAMNLLGEWLSQAGRDFGTSSTYLRHSGLSDYIEQEVLVPLTDDETQARILASLVSFANRDLIDAISGTSDLGRSLISVSERLPGLIDDMQGNIYLNPLLRAYCSQQFEALGQEVRESAIANASEACMSAGRIAEATGLIERSSADNAIVEYVRRSQGLRLWFIAGFDVIRSLIARAPPETIASEPRLKLLKCMVHLKEGQVAEAEALLSETLPLIQDDESALIDAEVVRATLQIYGCRTSTIKSLGSLQNLIRNNDDVAWKSLITTIQCISYCQEARFDEAAAKAAEAEMHTRLLGSDYNLMFLEFHMAGIALARGELVKGRAALGRARKCWTQQYSDDVGAETVMNALRASVEFEAGHVTSARAYLRKSAARMPHTEAWFDIYVAAYEPMARLMLHETGLSSTLGSLSSLRAQLKTQGLHRVSILVQALAACLVCEAILQGRAERSAFGGVRFSSEDYDDPVVTWQEKEIFTLAAAYCAIVDGDAANAIEQLAALIQYARELGLRRTELRSLLLLAEANGVAGDAAAADEAFGAALSIAAETGMHRMVYELGGSHLRAQISRAVEELEAAKDADQPRARVLMTIERWLRSHSRPDQSLVLTTREHDVLGALNEGGSDKMIGRRLGVSEHAVRFHLKSIFRKLEVHDRVAALNRARTAGILGR